MICFHIESTEKLIDEGFGEDVIEVAILPSKATKYKDLLQYLIEGIL